MGSPRSLLEARGLRPRKRLGQHFLADPSVPAAILARAGPGPGETVLEIGPGLGALTIPLSRACARVLAVEKDRELFRLLGERLAAEGIGNVEPIAGDILTLDLAGLSRRAGGRLAVFGNLPYNISSQVVVRLIAGRAHVSRAVLMFQRELAERLRAAPGGRQWGRLSVLLALTAEVRPLLRVGPGAFHPRPRVDSEVVEIRFAEQAAFPPEAEAPLFRLVAAAFGQRRKTLRNALRAGLPGLAPRRLEEALAALGIDPRRRAETLAPADFVRLAARLGA